MFQSLHQVDIKDLLTALHTRRGYVDVALKPARAEQGIVKHNRAIGGRKDGDIPQLFHPIKLCQDLRDNSLGYTGQTFITPPFWDQGIILSKKMMRGEAMRAFLKISHTPFSDSPIHFESNSGPFTTMK